MNESVFEKLQLFAEGAGGEGNAEGAENSGETTGGILSGEQIENTASVNQPEESFEEMISGKYKADFEKLLSERLEEKDNKISELSSLIEKHGSLLEALSAKYDIKNKNIDEVLAAVSDDDSYYEEAAAREGLTVRQYKQMQELQKQQEEYQAMKQAELARTQAQRDIQKWFKESEALKEIYPDFDLKTELKNRDFVGLLKNGINVKTAYEVFHVDDITRGAAKIAAQNAEKSTVAKLQSKAARPVENGTNAQSGAVLRSGMANLSRKDREELARRAQRGEVISF